MLGRVAPGKALFPWDLIWNEIGFRNPENKVPCKLNYLCIGFLSILSLHLVNVLRLMFI